MPALTMMVCMLSPCTGLLVDLPFAAVQHAQSADSCRAQSRVMCRHCTSVAGPDEVIAQTLYPEGAAVSLARSLQDDSTTAVTRL